MLNDYIVLIKPIEECKDTVLCDVKFYTGSLKGTITQLLCPSSIFRYYYKGLTMELVTLDDKGNLVNIRDAKRADFSLFNLDMFRAYAFNTVTHEALGSNGILYSISMAPAVRNYGYALNPQKKHAPEFFVVNSFIYSS